jgi:tRNA pseudouridine55 synthase
LPLTPFSAKKVNGKKLYEYAREWKPIFLTVPMTLYGYEILDYSFPLLKISLRVGTGTYIRSIAHRLGISCGWDALVTSLVRTSIAEYFLSDITKNPNQIALWDDKQIEYIIL